MRNFFAHLTAAPRKAFEALRGKRHKEIDDRHSDALPADDVDVALIATARLDRKDEGRAAAQRQALTKSRPRTIEQRYELLAHDGVADALFERLKRHVYQDLDARARANPRAPLVWREAGRIAPNRHYFFLKSPGETGWLFERNGTGWVIARAEKIAARDLFLRRDGAHDRALLFLAKDEGAFPRIRSPLFGDSLLPFAVYEQKLLEKLGI